MGAGIKKYIIFIILILAIVCLADTFRSHLQPATDNSLDLGTSSLEWRNLYIDGTAYIDNLSLGTPINVANGGIGVGRLTDGGLLVGSGAWPITALGVAANGQIPIGDGTTDPQLATITAVSNETDVTNGAGSITIGIVNPLIVAKGGTGAETLTDGGVLLGSGTGAITAMSVLADGEFIVGDGTTDPTTLAAFTSSTGTLYHEYGGLEANVSAYSGLLKIAGGSTTQVTDNSTNWNTAYTHSQDNTQAHSDYLINNGNDSTSGELTASKFHAGGVMTLESGSITDITGAISFGDENLSTTGNLSAAAITGSDLLTINQSADSDGIQINGFDDVNDDYVKLCITSGGNSTFDSSSDFPIKRGGSSKFSVSSSSITFYNDMKPRYDATKYCYGESGGDGYFNFSTNAQMVASNSHDFNFVGYDVIKIPATLKLLERSTDPTEPGEGECVIWMSDGTGKGDDGDVLIASKAGGTTKWTTLFDHSAGAAW